MESIRLQDNYVSLKTRYQEAQVISFPCLSRERGGAGEVDHADEVDETDVENIEKSEADVLPLSPIEERDKTISDMQKKLETYQEQFKEVEVLRETVTKVKAENSQMKKSSKELNKKLNLTRKTNEIKLAEIISSGSSSTRLISST